MTVTKTNYSPSSIVAHIIRCVISQILAVSVSACTIPLYNDGPRSPNEKPAVITVNPNLTRNATMDGNPFGTGVDRNFFYTAFIGILSAGAYLPEESYGVLPGTHTVVFTYSKRPPPGQGGIVFYSKHPCSITFDAEAGKRYWLRTHTDVSTWTAWIEDRDKQKIAICVFDEDVK